MESSRRDLSNDMAEHRPILKKPKYVLPLFKFHAQNRIPQIRCSCCEGWRSDYESTAYSTHITTDFGHILKLKDSEHHINNSYLYLHTQCYLCCRESKCLDTSEPTSVMITEGKAVKGRKKWDEGQSG